MLRGVLMLEGGELLEQIAAGNINSIEQDVSIRRSSSVVYKHGWGTTIYKAIWREKGGGGRGGDIKFGDVIDAISEGSDIIYSKLTGYVERGEGRV